MFYLMHPYLEASIAARHKSSPLSIFLFCLLDEGNSQQRRPYSNELSGKYCSGPSRIMATSDANFHPSGNNVRHQTTYPGIRVRAIATPPIVANFRESSRGNTIPQRITQVRSIVSSFVRSLPAFPHVKADAGFRKPK